MITWQMFIALFAPTAFFLCFFLVLAVWPRCFVYVRLYLVLPFRGRGEAITTSHPVSDEELERLPREQRDPLAVGIARLGACGFAVATHVRSCTDSGWGVAAVLLNESGGASAQVMAMRHELPDLPPFSNDCVTFCTEFSDETAMVTTNSGVGVFRPDPTCDSVLWPGMRDLGLLYRLHAARVDRRRGGRQTRLPSPEAAFAYAVAHEAKTLWRQVEAGDYWFDAAGGAFRRTLKGSFLQHWKLLWPWKQRLIDHHDQNLRRALREVGMGTPEEYSPDPKDEVKPALAYHSATAR